MSTAALEPPTFRNTTSLLTRAGSSRAASLLILLGLALLVIAPSLWRGQLFPRPTPYVAAMQYAVERLRADDVPQWNPHEHLGEPMARDGRFALWYPATLIYLALPEPQAWRTIAVVHLWLAGVGAWLLAGRYGLEPVPRLMTGAAYMLCGANVLGLESAQANVVVWLPWAALAVERLSERVTSRRILLAALVLTVQFLGGDLLASAALVLTCTLALLIRAFWIGPTRLVKAMIAAASALLIAVAASAVQWLPVVWPWRQTPLAALSDVLRAWPWGAGPFVISATSPAMFGTIPLALAFVAVFFGRRPRAVVLWTVVGAVLALLIIGFEIATRSPAAAALRTFPRPRILIAGVSLAVAVIAGFGIETIVALAAERAARLRATLFWLAAAAAGIAIVVTMMFRLRDPSASSEFMLQGARLLVGGAMLCAAALVVRSHELPQWRSRGWAWIVLACAELVVFAVPATRGVPIRDLGDVSDIATFLRAQPNPARYITADGALPEALATWQSLEDARGAGHGSSRYEAWSAAASASGGRYGPDALRIANVRYVVTNNSAPPLAPPWRKVHANGSLTVYADDDPLPRVWVAPQGRHVALASEALEWLATTTPVNPRDVALLDDTDADPVDRHLIDDRPGYWSHRATDSAAAEVTHASPDPEEVSVRVRQGGGGWLVMSDAFARGWHATIHGSREPLVAAFGAFRAVQIPAGNVEVMLTYDPPQWRHALLVSAAGGAVMLLLFAWSLLRPRRPQTALPARLA